MNVKVFLALFASMVLASIFPASVVAAPSSVKLRVLHNKVPSDNYTLRLNLANGNSVLANAQLNKCNVASNDFTVETEAFTSIERCFFVYAGKDCSAGSYRVCLGETADVPIVPGGSYAILSDGDCGC